MRRRTTYSTAVVVAVFALCTATPRTAAQTHKTEHRDWRLTCGEGGEKDPKKPNWTPPTWVYLNCGQYNIGDVVFASWGTPEGSCSGAVGTSDSFHKGTCDSKASVEKVKAQCVGKPKCKIPAGPAGAADGSGGNNFFGADPCTGTPKRLAVVVSCADGAWGGTFLLVAFVCSLIYVAGGVGYRMRVQKMTWAKDGWHVLPNFDVWMEVHCLVSDGISFTVERYYRARGIEYNPAPLPIPVQANVPTQAGTVTHAATYGSTSQSEQDDALWSDEDSDGEGGTDFKTAKAILESALPELDDGEEWATDSEEEFE